MPVITVGKIDENQEKEITGGTVKESNSGYCPFTPERVCRVDPLNGYYEENAKCKNCTWRD